MNQGNRKTDSQTLLENLKAAEKAREKSSSHRTSIQDALGLNQDSIADSQTARRQDASKITPDYIAQSQADWRKGATRLNRDADQRNIDFSARQLMIEGLPPIQQVQQDAWAFQQFAAFDFCPKRQDWSRVGHGYRCAGGYHFVPHELLAQGTPGYYERLWAMVVKVRGDYPIFGHLDAMREVRDAWKTGNSPGHGPLQAPQQLRYLIPADGYWWIGPTVMPPGGMGRSRGGRGMGSTMARGTSFDGTRPPPGPGDPLPAPRNFGYPSWQNANISFPNGMVCGPGPGYKPGKGHKGRKPYAPDLDSINSV